jgi:hypothetical protein
VIEVKIHTNTGQGEHPAIPDWKEQDPLTMAGFVQHSTKSNEDLVRRFFWLHLAYYQNITSNLLKHPTHLTLNDLQEKIRRTTTTKTFSNPNRRVQRLQLINYVLWRLPSRTPFKRKQKKL